MQLSHPSPLSVSVLVANIVEARFEGFRFVFWIRKDSDNQGVAELKYHIHVTVQQTKFSRLTRNFFGLV